MSELEALHAAILAVTSVFNQTGGGAEERLERATAFYDFCAPIVEPHAPPLRLGLMRLTLSRAILLIGDNPLLQAFENHTAQDILDADKALKNNCGGSPVPGKLLPNTF